ncbi:hypothetical protein K402DRAFT_391663 [Aulographum hederae CBS 113979]|uniref:Integral membrane protein, Mpv17/PMP22 family n=1 Tax=Aulographum hederae CBS 113979 TaxID=1176131 RepID=A0A6G1H5U6_9PEZI|nr:hypothetical protein K402DRAFT_391663 [Aulographum hederae CBS 113979]
MSRFLRWYQTKLKTNPLATQSVTTAVLFATGDTMAQQGVERVEKHDFARTGRMALYGGCVFGPAATTWFSFLSRLHPFGAASPNANLVARVALDQTIFASTNLFVFLSSMALMEGSSPSAKLESSYWEALKKNWMLWPAVQITNFKFVPLEARVGVVNVVSLGWNCYLSFLNSQGKKKGDVEQVKGTEDRVPS